MSSSQEDHQRRDIVAPRVLVVVLTMFGGGAIAVGVLLPALLITQQSNNLSIARLEAEVAQMRSALASAPAPSPRPSVAAPVPAAPQTAAPAVPETPARPAPRVTPGPATTRAPAPRQGGSNVPSAPRDAGRAPSPIVPDPPPETAATPSAATRETTPAPAAAVSADTSPTSSLQSLTDVEVRVEYAGRCLDVAMDVAKRLNSLGAAPDMVQRDSADAAVGRLTYARAEQVATATRLAERLGDIVPVEIAFDSAGPADPIRLRLSNDPNCGRAAGR